MAEPFALLRINLRYIYNKDFGLNKNTQRFARYKNINKSIYLIGGNAEPCSSFVSLDILFSLKQAWIR